VIAARPDDFGVCHVEAEDHSEKVTMVRTDENFNDDEDDTLRVFLLH